jgi:DNA-binding transcriptional MerR regulator
VSESLGIPPSTLRRYAADWREYLSESARVAGVKRLYTEQDVIILGKLRDLIRRKMSPDKIAAALLVQDESPDSSSALALLPQVLEVFEDFRARFASQEDEIASLRNEIELLRADLESKKRPWWERLFKG